MNQLCVCVLMARSVICNRQQEVKGLFAIKSERRNGHDGFQQSFGRRQNIHLPKTITLCYERQVNVDVELLFYT